MGGLGSSKDRDAPPSEPKSSARKMWAFAVLLVPDTTVAGRWTRAAADGATEIDARLRGGALDVSRPAVPSDRMPRITGDGRCRADAEKPPPPPPTADDPPKGATDPDLITDPALTGGMLPDRSDVGGTLPVRAPGPRLMILVV